MLYEVITSIIHRREMMAKGPVWPYNHGMRDSFKTGKTLYGNEIPDSIVRKAERRFNKYAAKFGYDPARSPTLTCVGEGWGFEDFGMRTVRDAASLPPGAGEPFDVDRGMVIGTIRMGFGHSRMAIAIASAARALGYDPYWLDLMSFPGTAARDTIEYLEGLYNLGSRVSQRSKLVITSYSIHYTKLYDAKNVTVIEEETDRLAQLTDRVRDFLHSSPGRPETRSARSYSYNFV